MRCSCGRPRPLNPPVIGIQYGVDSALILWNCQCGSTRAIPWNDASEPMKAEGRIAELTLRKVEMAGWGG